MASHLTIISAMPGGVNSRNFGARNEDGGGTTSPFAALIAGEPNAAAAGRTANGAPAGGKRQDAESAEILAAALDLKGADIAPADPAPLVDFIEALTALKAGLDRGAPLDPELLGRVEDALEALAAMLGLTLDELAGTDDLAAALDQAEAEPTGFAATLDLLSAFLVQMQAEDAIPSAIAARLKGLDDKLSALLAALEAGAVSEEKLAALGMKRGAPELEAALARFAAALAEELPEEPALAAPSLRTSEPVLGGKSADAPPQAGDAVKLDDTGNSGDERSSERRNEPPRPEARAANAPNGSAPSDPAAAAAAAPVQQDPAALRADAGPRLIQAGYQTSQQQLNLPQLAFELARQVQDGNTRFQIRLDPPELGKIDVRLDIDKTGQVHARLTVEKSETLDLMQRDQRVLERALQQAGLDSSKTNLEFSLKQNPFAGQDGQDRPGDRQPFGGGGGEPGQGEAQEAMPSVHLYRGSLQASGVNIIA
ncbi:flagellar hook-length control protein FliK [Devosia sp. YIM 151766]|uniref:flagellar hook-length control protein FliK n=1 Tax=Devosia sp. YIM 151766 TaxID=3017325 RepID=UPI00255CE31E|nr:flagellar hook-length control protein FliK [Devosia sp. YIM 151766]WIY52257.1 flagellar hook-length control protein FliK [Devosia sp. YIM 151766]